MSRYEAIKAAKSGKSFATADSFQNLLTRTGIGAANVSGAGTYTFDFKSRNRVEMEAVYRSSWIAGKAVDAFAEDMTREGIDIKCDVDPDQLEQLEKAATRLQIWDAICDTIKWARLYGGAVAVHMIDGQRLSEPLRPETIRKGQYRGLFPLDRWMVTPSLNELVTEYGDHFGQPKFYDVVEGSHAFGGARIHHSRLIRIDGVDLPYWQKIAENLWGQSVLERLWDRLMAFDSTTQGAAQLVYKAHLRTYKVKGLRQLIAMGGPAFDALVKQIEMIRAYQVNEGMTLMDGEDEFEAHQYTFAGLSDMLLQFGQQLSGAIDIPLVRLFGQSPAGLNSTGESDIRNYYDTIKQQQERKLRSGVSVVYDLLWRSEFGEETPDTFNFTFCPLWQMSDEEKATIAGTTATAVATVYDSGIIDRKTALAELRQSSQVTGTFSNVTDEDIEEAEEDMPPGGEELLNGEASAEPGEAESGGEDVREATQEPGEARR